MISRAVYTWWSCKPWGLAGWPDSEFHRSAWKLSVQLSRQIFDEVVLYTDSEGAKELAGCDWTEIQIVYDDLHERLSADLWAIPKLITASLQEVPYVHIDGDVFLWEPIPEDKLQADWVFFCKERANANYLRDAGILRHLGLYRYWYHEVVWNAGVIGGCDLESIHRYAAAGLAHALEWEEPYREEVGQVGGLNWLIEQHLVPLFQEYGSVSKPLVDTYDFLTDPVWHMITPLRETFARDLERKAKDSGFPIKRKTCEVFRRPPS